MIDPLRLASQFTAGFCGFVDISAVYLATARVFKGETVVWVLNIVLLAMNIAMFLFILWLVRKLLAEAKKLDDARAAEATDRIARRMHERKN